MHCRQCQLFVSPKKGIPFICPNCGSQQKPVLLSKMEIFGIVSILIVVPLLCFIAWQLAMFKNRLADNITNNVNQNIQKVIKDNSNLTPEQQKEKIQKTVGVVQDILNAVAQNK